MYLGCNGMCSNDDVLISLVSVEVSKLKDTSSSLTAVMWAVIYRDHVNGEKLIIRNIPTVIRKPSM